MTVKLAQGTVFSDLRERFKKRVKNTWLREQIKKLVRALVNIVARLKGVSFPEKYTWSWQLEMLLEKYEPETTALVKKIVKPGMVIVDVGAHIGYYTKMFSRLVRKNGRVFAFEPDEANFKLLEQNSKTLKNAKIFKKALSDRSGNASFFRSQNTGCHSLVKNREETLEVIVEASTLDEFAAESGLNKIDLIKMDIEGGEPQALEGAKETLKRTSMLIMEFTPENFLKNNINPASFFQKLEDSFGFSAYAIKYGGRFEKIIISNDSLKNLVAGKDSVNIFLKK